MDHRSAQEVAASVVCPQQCLNPLAESRGVGASAIQVRLALFGRPTVEGRRKDGHQVLVGVVHGVSRASICKPSETEGSKPTFGYRTRPWSASLRV
jgi:hypothetical protein